MISHQNSNDRFNVSIFIPEGQFENIVGGSKYGCHEATDTMTNSLFLIYKCISLSNTVLVDHLIRHWKYLSSMIADLVCRSPFAHTSFEYQKSITRIALGCPDLEAKFIASLQYLNRCTITAGMAFWNE
jgi:hypothetical protein